jgi:anaerobic magnesium-protoporphyrin IX monomethyl ester cyclase
MTDLELINPPSPYLIDDKAMPPLGLMYLAGFLKRRGFDVRVIDDFDEERLSAEAGLWGISLTTPQVPEGLRILRRLRQRFPNARVVAGGPHATVAPRELLEQGFDQVVAGEGEHGLLSILEGDRSDLVQGTPVADLDTFGIPDRDSVDLERYHYWIGERRCTTVITQRGCPYGRCVFCSQVWPKVRYHSAEHVARDLADVLARGYRAVTVFDDIFFSRPERDRAIMQTLGQLGFHWRCLSRSSNVVSHPELIEVAAANGCREVALGIETACSELLREIRKGLTLQTHERAIEILRGSGLRLKLNCILGLPGESHESIEQLDRFLERVRPDVVDITTLAVYPGTPLWDRPEDYDLQFERSYLPFKTIPGKYRCGVSTSHLSSAEIVAYREQLERKHRRSDA